MRQVIERVAYDTDKAELLHYSENMDDATDFAYRGEELYQTPRGNFFLVYRFGGCYADDSYIEPVSTGDAADWLERNGGSEVVEQLLEVEEA